MSRIYGLTFDSATQGYGIVIEYNKYGDMRRAMREIADNELYKKKGLSLDCMCLNSLGT